MLQITDSVINEIVNRADIVEVIGKAIKLRRSGTNFFGICPFHQEKSPSFAVNANKQFFHCFGCHESGDVITFYMKYKGLDFVEAVKILAQEYAVDIPTHDNNLTKQELAAAKEHALSLHDLINKTAAFYQLCLDNESAALLYLRKRGLNNEVIRKFGIGYAPTNMPTGLADALNLGMQKSDDLLQEAGLVIRANERLFNRFQGRVMFPLKNTRGQIIAFGGRLIGKGEPKYLNSPETSLFNKSLELYGLYEAQAHIRKQKRVIVVEGYMDVVSLTQFGITHVVATMGTAVTEEHIKKLFRLCDDIYYCFDGDIAGQKAAWRALERSMVHISDTKSAHFLKLPNEHDPDSFIRQFGTKSFENTLYHQSLTLSQYLLTNLAHDVEINTEEGKSRLISLAKPYLAKIKAVALLVLIKKQLAKMVNLDPVVLESILNNRSRFAFYNKHYRNILSGNNSAYESQGELVAATKLRVHGIIQKACQHIDWVQQYALPEDISQYSPFIIELIMVLDYLANHYHCGDEINIATLKQNLTLTMIDFDQVLMSTLNNLLIPDQNAFIAHLDDLFKHVQIKRIKVARIGKFAKF